MSRFGTRIGIGLKRAIGFLHSRLDRLIERMGLNLPEALKRALHIFTDGWMERRCISCVRV